MFASESGHLSQCSLPSQWKAMAHGQPEGWVSRRDWFSSLTVVGAVSDQHKSLCHRYLKLGEINVVPRIQKEHTETDLLAYQVSDASNRNGRWKQELQVRIITSLRDKCRENRKKHWDRFGAALSFNQVLW